MTPPLTQSDVTTGKVRVQTQSFYDSGRSDPKNGLYFFSYRIRITNEGGGQVRLLNRHWIISDALGRTEEVKGAGVIGEQPRLAGGETFEYTSFCPLSSPFGTMKGSYEMVDQEGQRFHVEIGAFRLLAPPTLN